MYRLTYADPLVWLADEKFRGAVYLRLRILFWLADEKFGGGGLLTVEDPLLIGRWEVWGRGLLTVEDPLLIGRWEVWGGGGLLTVEDPLLIGRWEVGGGGFTYGWGSSSDWQMRSLGASSSVPIHHWGCATGIAHTSHCNIKGHYMWT